MSPSDSQLGVPVVCGDIFAGFDLWSLRFLSMAQKSKPSQPAPDHRAGLISGPWSGFWFGVCSGLRSGTSSGLWLVVGDGGTVVQLSADEALAASDVVNAAE